MALPYRVEETLDGQWNVARKLGELEPENLGFALHLAYYTFRDAVLNPQKSGKVRVVRAKDNEVVWQAEWNVTIDTRRK